MNLYFTAEWCAPCQQMKPIMEKMISEYDVKRIDIDEESEVAKEYGVRSIPTYINHDDERLLGVRSEKVLREFFSK